MRTLHEPAARESLEVRLRGLGPDASARWGRMSADQMLWHVNTALKMALGEVDCEPVDGLLSRTVMKWGALFGPWSRLEFRHVDYHLRQFGA